MTAVIYKKEGNIAYITLNRADKMNAMNTDVYDGLYESWAKVADDDDVYSVIITGKGEKAFSSGWDLVEGSRRQEEGEDDEDWERHRRERPEIPIWKPVIAAINGYCLGGGLELALKCDIRIAAKHATFSLPEVIRGILPAGGGIQRLTRTIPFNIALELMLTGDRIDSQRAYDIGLVNKVVPKADLIPTCRELADRLNKGARQAVMAIKEAAYKGYNMPLSQALELDRLISATKLHWTEDSKEGPNAFADKRKSKFKGR